MNIIKCESSTTIRQIEFSFQNLKKKNYLTRTQNISSFRVFRIINIISTFYPIRFSVKQTLSHFQSRVLSTGTKKKK